MLNPSEAGLLAMLAFHIFIKVYCSIGKQDINKTGYNSYYCQMKNTLPTNFVSRKQTKNLVAIVSSSKKTNCSTFLVKDRSKGARGQSRQTQLQYKKQKGRLTRDNYGLCYLEKKKTQDLVTIAVF